MGAGGEGTPTAGLGQGGPAGWDARGVSAPLWSLKATGGSQAQDRELCWWLRAA